MTIDHVRDRARTQRPAIVTYKSWLLSLLVGILFVGNQLGPVVAHYVPISFLSSVWSINTLARIFTTPIVVVLSGVLLFLHYLVLRRHPALQRPFSAGLLTGLLAFPVAATLLALAAGVLWLVGTIFHLLAIPMGWIMSHLILPILAFLGAPFAWVWRHLLRPIVVFLGIPFVWIYAHLVAPLLAWLVIYLFKPIVTVLAVAVVASSLAAMLATIGSVVVQMFKDTFVATLTSETVFGYGIGLGFFMFETILSSILFAHNLTAVHPSLVALLPLGLGTVFLLRLVAGSGRATLPSASYARQLAAYWKSSPASILVPLMLIPVGMIASYVGDQSD